MNEVKVLVTGEAFIGGGCRSIDLVMEELVEGARNEIHLATYLVTSSGILRRIRAAVERGVRVVAVINDLRGQPMFVRSEIVSLARSFPSFIVEDFSEQGAGMLHAKVLVVDRTEAIVGSANLTDAAMDRNHEIAVLVRGAVADEIAQLVDGLISRRARLVTTRP